MKLNPGDRIAYSAKFLKNIGAFTGPEGFRRGTLVSIEYELARVKWDDFNYASAAKMYGSDYADNARDNGQLVNINNIAKVGSARFALNDM
jgi:hypothetical protein